MEMVETNETNETNETDETETLKIKKLLDAGRSPEQIVLMGYDVSKIKTMVRFRAEMDAFFQMYLLSYPLHHLRRLNMNFEQYTQISKRTANTEPPVLSGDKSSLLNWVIGLVGECGEFANLLKKYLFHNHPITREVFIDELGDIMYYIAMIMQVLGISFDEVLEYNVKKLSARYPNGFSEEASRNRKE